MAKSRTFLSILIPSATVFFSSACIMIIELVAGRLIARSLGSSLYTWTSVIGVVLAGITIGNYTGGRIADRFPAKKALSALFGLASVACAAIVILNNVAGNWLFLWQLSWPVRVFSHVALVFLVPSAILGMISPVVAKMALDQGLQTGRTVGDIYAWGAAGSIVGTFLAGFYLIAAMGTIAIIWTVGLALLALAILYWTRLWILYIWAAIFIALMTMGMAPINWAKENAPSLGIRERPDPRVLYHDETQYCYVGVKQISSDVDKREFMQDKLKHSEIIMGDINDLQYPYSQIYAAITTRFSKNRTHLSTLTIGGGGYVFPRWVKKLWPDSQVDVAEIDPGVTKAAIAAFGLESDTNIRTISLDARNYIDELLRSGTNTHYDFIYEDAINDYTVPFQLTTKEFNDKIARVLSDDGIYMVNLIDMYDSALFLGAMVNTIKLTFPYVYVVTEAELPHSFRSTFVIVASMQSLNLDNLKDEYKEKHLNLWLLNDSELKRLKEKSRSMAFTDDYAPVENLLAPVVCKSAKEFLAIKYIDEGARLKKLAKFDDSIATYQKVLQTDPDRTVQVYNEIAMILLQQGRLSDAVGSFKKAVEYNDKCQVKVNIASIYFNLALVLKQLDKKQEAQLNFEKATQGFRKLLVDEPKSILLHSRLGDTLAEMGDFAGGAEEFLAIVDLAPYDINNHLTLAQALQMAGKPNDALAALKKAEGFMNYVGRKDDAVKLQQQINLMELQKNNVSPK